MSSEPEPRSALLRLTAEDEQLRSELLTTRLDAKFDEYKQRSDKLIVTTNGVVGHGKSSLLDNLADFLVPSDNMYFKCLASTRGVTDQPDPVTITYRGVQIKLVDQAGLLDARTNHDVEALRRQAQYNTEHNDEGYNAIVLVQPFNQRFNAAEKAVLVMTKTLLGDTCVNHMMVALTKADGVTSRQDVDRLLGEFGGDLTLVLGKTVPICPVVNVYLEDQVDGGPRRRTSCTGVTRVTSAAAVWENILELSKQKPFKPKQITTVEIQQAQQEAKRVLGLTDAEWAEVWKAVQVIVPFAVFAFGCTIL